MRVALFFDGKNHMKDLRRAVADRWVDHGRLADWMVAHVGGTQMFGAFYYTGVPNPAEDLMERNSLVNLLEDLERRPGFFVHRFPRRASARDCPHCNKPILYTEEKQVDTSLVADVVLFAVRDAYDIAVVFSGDGDVAPALEAARSLGKRAIVATFTMASTSRTLQRSAWSTVDLSAHLDAFTLDLPGGQIGAAPTTAQPEDEADRELLRELRRAEAHFGAGGGFVGAQYFIHRWKGHNISDSAEDRRQALQRLIAGGYAESYSVEGRGALRATHAAPPGFEDEVTLDSTTLGLGQEAPEEEARDLSAEH